MSRRRKPSRVAPMVTRPPIGPVGDVTLVDVGASGGISDDWSVFGDAFAAVAFDPLVNNMRRVSATETRPKVRYEAAYVGCHDYDRLFPPEQRQVRVAPYLRASCIRAMELMRLDFVADNFNASDELVWSDRHITLDDYFPPGRELDFLKVDTDGSDIQVLLGAERLIEEGAFLGMMLEVQFQGWPHDYANVFANIDRFLRARGFQLYDVDHNRYTRAALPGRFEANVAQTLTGQLLWGDAIYFRDLAHPLYEETWRYTVTRERLLKLVALFDVYALPDCAAELLLARPDLTTADERTQLLDALVQAAGFDGSYAEHMQRFATRPASFLPQADAPAPPPAQPDTLVSRLRSLKRRLGV